MEKPSQVQVTPSVELEACRKLVRDDAFEVQISLHAVRPLLQDALRQMKSEQVRAFAIYLRRSLTRYLALGMCRLLERPKNGPTGVTASIQSLLERLKAENVLPAKKIAELDAQFAEAKKKSADGEYDLVKALRDLRNIQVAHTLMPHKDPTDQVWAHHLVEFAEAIVQFVVEVDDLIADATGVALSDLRGAMDKFDADAHKSWEVLKAAI